jgi:hypothetical protein
MALPPVAQALKTAKIVRWTAPTDYLPVAECLKRIITGKASWPIHRPSCFVLCVLATLREMDQ